MKRKNLLVSADIVNINAQRQSMDYNTYKLIFYITTAIGPIVYCLHYYKTQDIADSVLTASLYIAACLMAAWNL